MNVPSAQDVRLAVYIGLWGFLIMFVLFVTTGCALTDSYEDHAREHNMLGQQVCNTLIEDVMPEDTLVRGCPTDVNTNTEGNIQSESESRKETEEAL